MIRVTVELLPKGDATRARVLGRMEIANDGTGNGEEGNYQATLHAEYTPATGRKLRVLGFKRRRQSVWTLVGIILKNLGHCRQTRGQTIETPEAEGERELF